MRRHALLLVLCPLIASADTRTYVVQRGETLERVAEMFNCTTDAVLSANNRTNTLVPPGTTVKIPSCAQRIKTRTLTKSKRIDSDDAKAAQALATIDGTATVIVPTNDEDHDGGTATESRSNVTFTPSGDSHSLGQPWNGRLENGEHLPADDDAYKIRRPNHAWGAENVVTHLRAAIASVRALHDVHVLAIGDLSAKEGGKLSEHHSHQSGLDVDVGFYFTKVPDGYPDAFAPASNDLDLEATWALLAAFVRTTESPDGVQMIFLDYAVQKRLYDYAESRGTPAETLSTIFQYPRGKDTLAGIVRHWPNHTDHFHVRFNPAAD
ncbi:MAG TPA: penicillin-insensitive murein endopeptidase [Kofleriaceae bacterium]